MSQVSSASDPISWESHQEGLADAQPENDGMAGGRWQQVKCKMCGVVVGRVSLSGEEKKMPPGMTMMILPAGNDYCVRTRRRRMISYI